MQTNSNRRIAIILTLLMAALFIPTTSFASDDADTITYSVDAGDDVDFNEDDFNDACQDLNDTDLNYVKFDLPSSSKGILYYDYDGSDEAEVDDSDKYYYDDDDSISDVTFVADDDYDGTVSISYTGYDEDGNSYSGTVKITVSGDDSSSGDIEYSVDAGDEVDFDEDDFNDFCQDENDADLDYVTFDLPSSSKGTLYYDYDGDDEEELDDSDEYYYDDDPSISDITFVAEDDYDGDCSIDFTGYDADGNSIEGTVVISVDGESDDAGTAADLYYSGVENTKVTFDEDFFNNKCEDLTDNTLDYIKFTLPSSSYGTLYYGYTSAGSYTSKVSASTKYYYNDDSPYLSKVVFVPADDYTGKVTVSYTGYDTDGTSYTGEIIITISSSSSSSSVTSAGMGSGTTATPAQQLAAQATATPTSSKVIVDGTTVSFDAYNINGNNYFKLRDLAAAISGTAKQFGVSYDSTKNAITLTTGSTYVSVGGELASGGGMAKIATLSTSPIYKDGSLASLGAYNINGNNYFKLRDLAKAFNIGVTWNSTSNTVQIVTSSGYTE